MIVYLADRDLNIVGTAASTHLPDSIRIVDDTKTEEIETGTRSFEVALQTLPENTLELQEVCTAGNFLLRSSDDGIDDELYNITEVTFDAESGEIRIYAEDAGLDMLNVQVPAYTAPASHTAEWYINHYLTTYAPDWHIGEVTAPTNTRELKWESEATLLERIQEIADNFNCEISFSYAVDGLRVSDKFVNIFQHRGNDTPAYNLYLGKEIANITRTENVENLATAFTCTGGIPSGKKKAINLSGCNYSSDGTTTHDPADPDDPYQIVGKQVRCIPAMEKWRSAMDPDGLLLRQYTYNTTKKKELFSHAVSELRKVVDAEMTYEVELVSLPDGVKVGDRVNIIDDNDEIYVDARILVLERSVTNGTINMTLGEYIIKTSGIVDRVRRLEDDYMSGLLENAIVTITPLTGGAISSSDYVNATFVATVMVDGLVITNQQDLEDSFGPAAAVRWSGPTGWITGTEPQYTLSNDGFTLTITNDPFGSTDINNYSCTAFSNLDEPLT